MNTPFNNLPKAERIVYVRPVAVEDLPDAVRQELDDRLEVVYSVHTADGAQVALVVDRNMAFDLARQQDFSMMSVH